MLMLDVLVDEREFVCGFYGSQQRAATFVFAKQENKKLRSNVELKKYVT